MTSADLIGLIGVVMILVVYAMLQLNQIKHDTVTYSLTNVIGSLLILYSLLTSWNLASFIIEVAWLGISLFGLIKAACFTRSGR